MGEYIESYCVDVRTESINICEDLEVQHIVRSAFVVIIIVIVVIYSSLKVTPGEWLWGWSKRTITALYFVYFTSVLFMLFFFFSFFERSKESLYNFKLV